MKTSKETQLRLFDVPTQEQQPIKVDNRPPGEWRTWWEINLEEFNGEKYRILQHAKLAFNAFIRNLPQDEKQRYTNTVLNRIEKYVWGTASPSFVVAKVDKDGGVNYSEVQKDMFADFIKEYEKKHKHN